MDASYYFATGQQIATGKGATEPFVWNYLNDPQTISNPAFAYWMPLPAILSALGMWLLRSSSFFAARIPYIALAAFIPVLTIFLAARFTNHKLLLLFTGIISLFSGAYLPYLTITETFVPYFILGGLFFIVTYFLFKEGNKPPAKLLIFILGLLAGLMHLTRADGILWLPGGFVLVWFSITTRNGEKARAGKFMSLIPFLLFGYLLIMAGWFVRNVLVFGHLFPTGSNLSLWFSQYDDLFTYPATSLSLQSFLAGGVNHILSVRGKAGLYNLESLIGVVGNILLFPFMLAGLWKTRKSEVTKFCLFMIAFLFCLMTLVFPFAGYRGGFFHSMSAFQIYLWVMAVAGIEVVVAWTIKKLRWVEKKARILFVTLLSMSVIVMTCMTFIQKTQPLATGGNGWDSPYEQFQQVHGYIAEINHSEDFTVMVNDSPGYYAATGGEAIQLASTTYSGIVELMRHFEVNYLLVDSNIPESIETLFSLPGDHGDLHLLGDFNDYFIYTLE
jgi:hypothetical protein